MAAETLTYVGELTVLTCWCGMRHAVPAELRNHQRRCHDNGEKVPSIYCPLGHSHVPSGEGKAERAERWLNEERERAARLDAEREQAAASARAYKGQATKLRKRAKAGTCPRDAVLTQPSSNPPQQDREDEPTHA